MIVGPAADLAVVAQVGLVGGGGGRGGGEADGGGIAARRRAKGGEGGGGGAAEGRRDRRAGVGVFVDPAQAEVETERALVGQADGDRQIGAERRAQRGRGLRRHVEAERLRARFAKTVLRPARRLEAAERGDRRGRRRVNRHRGAGRDLAEELAGAVAAGGGARVQEVEDELA